MSYVSSTADLRRQAQLRPGENRGVPIGRGTILCDISRLCNAFCSIKSTYYSSLIASHRVAAISFTNTKGATEAAPSKITIPLFCPALENQRTIRTAEAKRIAQRVIE
jgi:hypothetical protein